MAKLDDFLVKKKETAPILDLSKTTANSKEELRHLLEKVPDFKIKPEKVLPESIKIKEKKFMFKSSKYITKGKKLKSPFMDPIPVEMKNLKLEDLTSVPIDWRMLTNLRPKSKIEENYFSRMVELGKLQSKSRVQEKKQFQLESYVRKTKNKSGVVEMRIISCTECEEDFCNGKTCCIYGYDSFARIPDMIKTSEKLVSSSAGAVPKRKIKTRSRSKSKLKKKYKEKSKSPKKNQSK